VPGQSNPFCIPPPFPLLSDPFYYQPAITSHALQTILNAKWIRITRLDKYSIKPILYKSNYNGLNFVTFCNIKFHRNLGVHFTSRYVHSYRSVSSLRGVPLWSASVF
jgi:hypothetical protein